LKGRGWLSVRETSLPETRRSRVTTDRECPTAARWLPLIVLCCLSLPSVILPKRPAYHFSVESIHHRTDNGYNVNIAGFDRAFPRTTHNFVSYRTSSSNLYPSFKILYLELAKFDQLLRTHWRFFGNVQARPHMSPVMSHPAPSESLFT
jgi:hypothetical protein